jgi:hypothetical protein
VLFVVLCGVCFRVLSRCSFNSYWKIDISQLQNQPMIWASTLQIRKHGYFSDLGFIILFVGILPLYAINLCVVSLFADSSFAFLAMFVSDVLYQFEWMNIVLFLSKKIITFYLFSLLTIWYGTWMNIHFDMTYPLISKTSHFFTLSDSSSNNERTFSPSHMYQC